MKRKIIEWLEKERWYPILHPSKVETKAAELYNAMIDRLIERLKTWKGK